MHRQTHRQTRRKMHPGRSKRTPPGRNDRSGLPQQVQSDPVTPWSFASLSRVLYDPQTRGLAMVLRRRLAVNMEDWAATVGQNPHCWVRQDSARYVFQRA